MEEIKDRSQRKITKIAREANKLVIRSMKDAGIGSGEFDLIHEVRKHPGISQKDIANSLNMDKGAVARRVNSLEKKGYLTRKANPQDGRSQLLYATAKAEELKTGKASVEANFYTWLLKDLEEDELNAFLTTLDKIYLKSKQERIDGFVHTMPTGKENDGND